MTENRLSSNRVEGKKYGTRYGVMTAEEAAYCLLDRSWMRVRFLEEVFKNISRNSENFTLSEFPSMGLAAILEDIAIDLYAGHSYHYGGDPEPGKTDEAPEVKS